MNPVPSCRSCGHSPLAPVLSLGGWGVHMPYHTTWSHETEAEVDAGSARMRTVEAPQGLPAAIESIAEAAARIPQERPGPHP